MDERRTALLKSLIDDLNSKSNDDFFKELIEAGIVFDDNSESINIQKYEGVIINDNINC